MTYRYDTIAVYGLAIPGGGSERYRHVGQTFHYRSEILFSPVDANYRILVSLQGIPLGLPVAEIFRSL